MLFIISIARFFLVTLHISPLPFTFTEEILMKNFIFSSVIVQKKDAKSAINSQSAITCSKLTIETLEQGVKYVQSNNKDTRTTSLNIFHTLS